MFNLIKRFFSNPYKVATVLTEEEVKTYLAISKEGEANDME